MVSSKAVAEGRGKGFAGGAEERVRTRAEARDRERARYGNPRDQIKEQLRLLREHRGQDFLVFSKIEKYHQPVGDQFYSPILDPIYEDVQRFGRTLAVALGPLNIRCVNEPLCLSIDPYMAD